MKKGVYKSYESTLKEGYDSTSDQDDENEGKVPKKWPTREVIRCSGCNNLFRNQEKFMKHLKVEQYCWRERTHKPQKDMGNKNAAKSGGAGPSVELTLALPGPPAPPTPPSLALTLVTGNDISEFWQQQQQEEPVRHMNEARGNEGGAGGKSNRKKLKM